MSTIRIIIGRFSSAPFASGLQLLLAQTPEFEVMQLQASEDVEHALGEDRPQVLIVEGRNPSDFLHLLRKSGRLAVILLDPDAEEALVGFRRPDWRKLRRIVSALAYEAAMPSEAPVAERLRLLSSRDLVQDAPGTQGPSGDASGEEANVALICEWLDLTLARSLLPLARQETVTSVPGWAVSARDALHALDSEFLDVSPEAVEADHRRADTDLFVDPAGLPVGLCQIARAYKLDEVDLRLLCLVLAPEIDGKYATAMGVLQDDLTRRRPGLTLLAQLMGDAVSAWSLRSRLARAGCPLGRGLIGPDGDGRAALAIEVGYVASRAVVGQLLAGTAAAAHALGAALVAPAETEPWAEERPLVLRLRELLARGGPLPLIQLRERCDPAWFLRIASAAGVPVLCGAVRPSAQSAPSWAQVIGDWATLARVHQAGLVVTGVSDRDREACDQLGSVLAGLAAPVRFIAVDRDPLDLGVPPSRAVWRLEAPQVSVADRSVCWAAAAARAALPLSDAQAQRLGATWRLDREAIEACVELCAPGDLIVESAGAPLLDRLRRTARELLRSELPPAIRRIEPTFSWRDIVVSEDVEQQLRTVSAHVTYSGRVLQEWGFGTRMPYGQGVAALFSGPSGTGKTMAAQVIARDLGVDLLQVDLSKTISKYIGETEKNLDLVFDAAENASAALLFDEADALFGKRTQVRDAHDRHANVEVAYLLQRMEAFRGLAVLTTNLKRNIDDAFLRRFRFAIEFSMPDAAQRESIWRRSFPAGAPLADDLDLTFLARGLKLSGGSIQQIAIHAAFAAAADDGPIRMVHVVAATRKELLKVGMLNAEKALDGLAAA